MRYEAQHERAFQRAMAQILKLTAERLKAEIGSVSQKQKEELHEQKIERPPLLRCRRPSKPPKRSKQPLKAVSNRTVQTNVVLQLRTTKLVHTN